MSHPPPRGSGHRGTARRSPSATVAEGRRLARGRCRCRPGRRRRQRPTRRTCGSSCRPRRFRRSSTPPRREPQQPPRRAMAADLELTIPGADDEEPLADRRRDDRRLAPLRASTAPTYAARIDAAAITDGGRGPRASEVDRGAGERPDRRRAPAAASAACRRRRRRASSTCRCRRQTAAGRPRAAGRRRDRRSMACAVEVTEPALTTAEAEAARPQMQMVSSWTTYYVPGEGNGFGNNINIPARGSSTAATSRRASGSASGAASVPSRVERGYHATAARSSTVAASAGRRASAGGICSTSTTLFNAALRFGLEIGDPREPLLLHRPLSRRARRDRVDRQQLRHRT